MGGPPDTLPSRSTYSGRIASVGAAWRRWTRSSREILSSAVEPAATLLEDNAAVTSAGATRRHRLLWRCTFNIQRLDSPRPLI